MKYSHSPRSGLLNPQGRIEATMTARNTNQEDDNATVTIRVSGKLFQTHLFYLDQLVHSAGDFSLWPLLNLAGLEELDQAALHYLTEGENVYFGIVSCPGFVREWLEYEKARPAA